MHPDKKNKIADPSRRRLLQATLLGAVSGAVSGAATLPVVAQPTTPAAAPELIPTREALENLTVLEAQTLDAMVDRILPADENGPGARAARAIHYIDRSLGSFNAAHKPFYASSLQLLHELSTQRHGADFGKLSAEQQDALLLQMDNDELPGVPGSFFSLVRTHTLQGTFSDPYYGGNHQFVGWDLLGYPGIRLLVTTDEVAQGRSLAPTHLSAYDGPAFTKATVPGEDH